MKKLIQDIRKAKKVYTWCAITKHDGYYVQAVKSQLIDVLQKFDDSETVRNHSESDGNIYVG